MTELKKTALYDEHVKAKGRMVPFGGWSLPVQYTSTIDEHMTCRSAAGLFDVSHMGEVHVTGKNAEPFLNHIFTNDLTAIADGQAIYTLMCNEAGGIVDDLVVYKRNPEDFLVVANASNIENDFSHIKAAEKAFGADGTTLNVMNLSDQFTQIALQGPKAQEILSQLTDVDLGAIKTYWFNAGKMLDEIGAVIARTGYTGEDGFELYVNWNEGPRLWQKIMEVGTPLGMKPCGLGARDTLRLEMKYALYGNEISEKTNPIEAGLGWVVKLGKENFVGKDAIAKVKESGPTRKLVGIKMLERGIPRHGYPVVNETGTTIGEVCSGTQSPCLKEAIATAYVPTELAKAETEILVQVRNQKLKAKVVKTPFYKKS